uniref:Nitrilase and fragile histidine triad fusion protein NitFhit n=1 Tax=Plectus sambesii TaxID=2011161 RepID=A0A914V4R6_9BILA
MASTSRKTAIAVCQMTSTHDVENNFNVCADLIRQAKDKNAKMVFLPECFDYVGRNKEEAIGLAVAEDGPLIARFRELARQNDLWLSLGGFHEINAETKKNPFNTHLIINNEGATVAKYRKLHLFDVNIPGKVRLMESDFSTAGDRLVQPVQTPAGVVALSTCYDVRFPELSVWQRKRGAQILTFPSAFTASTGAAHWEVLLRARAVETQCYVVGATQTGWHNEKRESYGHAMVVDPWGKILAEISDGSTGVEVVEIDLDYVDKLTETVAFGEHTIHSATIFYRTPLSYAFVNRKPVVLGHVLVSPIRVVHHLTELTNEETADLFNAAKIVQWVLESVYDVTSSTVSVQDGPDAGQSVKHVHAHILPRRPGDFGDAPGNNIYEAIVTHDRDPNSALFRTIEHMAAETEVYRKVIAANRDKL